ncbi:MAG TPA: carboxypeptidase-like regulatory domain-containing protein [Blastocatellia bacterium]|nr:carboxypeptidase-like regulatory domain-containing protein [Blastocatellia bacterium]
MTEKNLSLDRLYIASPCSADWDEMSGDDKVRFCNRCNINVYNISALSRIQVEELIVKSEGRFCAKLYRRMDGTIITRDCPVGLRAVRRRVSHAASAALGALLGLFTNQTTIYADDANKNCSHYKAKFVRLESQENTAVILGKVKDYAEEVVRDAEVTLVNDETNFKHTVRTDNFGGRKHGWSCLSSRKRKSGSSNASETGLTFGL